MKERYWFFNDIGSGEEFYVLSETKEQAIEEALKYFDCPKCYGYDSEVEAEMSGLDIY